MTDKTIEAAEGTLNTNRTAVRDLIQRAYDAGMDIASTGHPGGPPIARPSAKEVNEAIAAVERGAVQLAHARMEYVAKACGFEGLTEALGYLQTLRDNPLATMLREVVNLCALGDVDEHTDALGWGVLIGRIKAVIGDEPPPPEAMPETVVIHDEVITEREVLSGCAVRATIQRESVNGSSPWAPREGSLRGRDTSGNWIEANPGDPLYSTVAMIATEMYNGTNWVPVTTSETTFSGGETTSKH